MFNEVNLMEEALKLAKEAFENDEVPVGAIIIDKNNEIIAKARNQCEKLGSPLKHAEILAIEQALEKRKNTKKHKLEGCTMIVTLEPCPMCASAISMSRIGKLVFGAFDEKSGGVENGARIFNQASCHHKPEVVSGIMQKECGDLMKDFFGTKRKAV